MCGRSTYQLTWEQIVRLYRLTMGPAPHNFRPRFNVCPTTTIDAIVAEDGKRELIRARWGLIPNWWRKPLKELKLATFAALLPLFAIRPVFVARLLGPERFLVAYASGLEAFGYRNSPLESMAYDAQASFYRSDQVFDAEKLVAEKLSQMPNGV